ncbi:MAG TPA: aminoglycoside phosphotransferase family protein, partial [Roseiflexaceae bacterium]|nr:aminoglycoside phosphotransferase family protein [Roseiflexaceae bacterium]
SFGQTFVSYPTRRVVQVMSAQGTFVAKIDDQPLVHDAPVARAAVFDFLARHGFAHSPALVNTRTDQRLIETAGQTIVLMEYLGGELPRSTPATWAQLGTIARTLNAFSTYPYPYGIDTSAAIAELRVQAETHRQRAQFHQWISFIAPVAQVTQRGLIHGEINLANTARRSNGTLVLLDWDEAGHGPAILEAAYPLIVVFLSEQLEFQRECAAAFYHSYYAGRAPGSDERDMLFRGAVLHALRYMQFANQQQRWERIGYAIAQQEQLLSVLP